MTYDCVVIGAGLSGLASSIILSQNGLRIALVERSDKTGPLLRGFRREGRYFDTGFHHAGGIGEGSAGRLMLDYLGVLRHIIITPANHDCFDCVRFSDSTFEFSFTSGFERLRQRLAAAFPDESQTIDIYLNEIKQQCSLLPFLNLNADLKAMNIFENVHGRSLSDFLALHTNNRYLKAALSVHCLLNGVPPKEQGLNNYAYIAGPYYESVNYIDGGGSALVDAFKKAAEERGVDILLNKDAERLMFSSSGDLKGVRFKDGTEIGSEKVISTIHPLHLTGLVPESRFRASYVKRIKSLDETPSAFILFGICETDLIKRIGTSVFLVPADGIDFNDHGKPIKDRPINIFVSEPGTENGNARSGFIMLCPASIKEVEKWKNSTKGNRPAEYLEFKEMICQRMLDHFAEFYPDLRGKLKAVEFSTPLTLRDYTGSPFGSMYGIKHRIEQYSPFPMTSIKGLYLAGQSIAAPGLLGTMISAFLACGNIIGHDFLRGELKRWN